MSECSAWKSDKSQPVTFPYILVQRNLPQECPQEPYSGNMRYFTQNTEEVILLKKYLLSPIQRQTTLNDLRQEFKDSSALGKGRWDLVNKPIVRTGSPFYDSSKNTTRSSKTVTGTQFTIDLKSMTQVTKHF